MEVLTAAILGPAQGRVNATARDRGRFTFGAGRFSQAGLKRFPFELSQSAHNGLKSYIQFRELFPPSR